MNNILKISIFLALSIFSAEGHSRCIAPSITPVECNFKNENTALILEQPGQAIIKESKLDQLLNEGSQLLEQYKASVKATDTDRLNGSLIQYIDSLGTISAQVVAERAAVQNNDPWSLKRFLDPTACTAFWAISGFDCPGPDDLLMDALKINELYQLGGEMEALMESLSQPLGEYWEDIIGNNTDLRAVMNGEGSMAKVTTEQYVNELLAPRFITSEIVANTDLPTSDEYSLKMMLMSQTTSNTTLDTMLASRQIQDRINADKDGGSNNILEKNRLAIGRMQALEVGNMGEHRVASDWADINQLMINKSKLNASETTRKMRRSSFIDGVDIKLNRTVSETIIGNEATPKF